MHVYRISCPIKHFLLPIRTFQNSQPSKQFHLCTYVYTFPVTTALRLARNTIYVHTYVCTYMMEWYIDASIIRNVYQANTLICTHIQELDQLHRVQQKLAWQCAHGHMRTSIHTYMCTCTTHTPADTAQRTHQPTLHNAHTSPHAQRTHQPTLHNAHTSPHAQRTHQPTCTTHTPTHTAQRTHQPTLHHPLTLHIALRVLVVPGVLVLTLVLRLEDLLQGLGGSGVVDWLRFLLAADGLRKGWGLLQ